MILAAGYVRQTQRHIDRERVRKRGRRVRKRGRRDGERDRERGRYSDRRDRVELVAGMGVQ